MTGLRMQRFERMREAIADVADTAAAPVVQRRLKDVVDFHDHLLTIMREARDRWCGAEREAGEHGRAR
jgi:hypothetical protein